MKPGMMQERTKIFEMHQRSYLFSKTVRSPAIWATALVIPTIPIHLFAPERVSIALAAVTLALIGGAYFGFAALDGRPRVIATEFPVAVFFGLAALLGLTLTPFALPLGLALHAFWDLLHHDGRIGARVPRWYIPFCVVFDLLYAVFLLIIFAT